MGGTSESSRYRRGGTPLGQRSGSNAIARLAEGAEQSTSFPGGVHARLQRGDRGADAKSKILLCVLPQRMGCNTRRFLKSARVSLDNGVLATTAKLDLDTIASRHRIR